ncbi:hypothetical protein HY464_02500 [Candidatus Peregrinibacteria bacterium]|nr:hypothetical protein [Candidatus Peregrinibacteria bacterium]
MFLLHHCPTKERCVVKWLEKIDCGCLVVAVIAVMLWLLLWFTCSHPHRDGNSAGIATDHVSGRRSALFHTVQLPIATAGEYRWKFDGSRGIVVTAYLDRDDFAERMLPVKAEVLARFADGARGVWFVFEAEEIEGSLSPKQIAVTSSSSDEPMLYTVHGLQQYGKYLFRFTFHFGDDAEAAKVLRLIRERWALRIFVMAQREWFKR